MCWRRTNKTEKAKEEQGKEDNSPKIQYKSLAPKEDLGDSEYFEALKFALQDSSVHNIAVAGKYGSGKSSVIGSFLAQYGKTTQIGENPLKSITIALAGDKKDKREDSLIEYEILEHLFFSADESELPEGKRKKFQQMSGHLRPRGSAPRPTGFQFRFSVRHPVRAGDRMLRLNLQHDGVYDS